MPPIRKLFRKLVAVGQSSCRQHLLIRGIHFSDPDIFHDRIVKQRYILEHYRIKRHQLFRIYSRYIHAADGYPASVYIPESGRKSRNCSLAASRRTDERSHLPLFCSERHIIKDSLTVFICESNVIEDYIASVIIQRL